MLVRSLDNAERFFRDVVGMTLMPQETFTTDPARFFQAENGSQIHTLAVGEPEQHYHLAMEVDSLDEVYQRVKDAGCPIRGGLHVRPDGSRYFFCQDFDGNIVEFTEHPGWALTEPWGTSGPAVSRWPLYVEVANQRFKGGRWATSCQSVEAVCQARHRNLKSI